MSNGQDNNGLLTASFDKQPDLLHLQAEEAALIQRLRATRKDGIIVLMLTKVHGKLLNVSVIGETQRETL